MLKYLIAVTESTIIMAILLGFLYAWMSGPFGRRGRRILTCGAAAGLVLSVVYTVLRNTTKVIDRSGGNTMWNVRVYIVSLCALVLLLIFMLPALRRRLPGAAAFAALTAGFFLTLTYVFCDIPEVLAYPFGFNLGGESWMSTAFLVRIIGYVLGLILAGVSGFSLYRVCGRMKTGTVAGFFAAASLVNALRQIAEILQVFYAKRWISGSGLFRIIRFTSNHSNLFIWACMAIAIIVPVLLWIASFRQKEPYGNPAEHRKIRAKWRSIRRWSTTVGVCFVIAVITLTWFSAIDSREIPLSPVEECEIDDENCYVALTAVDDGHLHRFAYTTEAGTAIRFIVIKKPGGSSYGIGLDACDICGETGYFERNGQIVCKLCDVVMNVNTIGFKGGCNPIVIDYRIENGSIVVPIAGLLEYEKEFR